MKLQNRWKIEGNKLRYYGMRNQPYTNKNVIKLTTSDKAWLANLTEPKTKRQQMFVSQGIVVEDSNYRETPTSYNEAHFCTNCCANDFMLPGLELDENGLCPMCQSKQLSSKLVSVIPTIKEVPKSKVSPYDVAVFYTGGKDSTYLLKHFAVDKQLRVLALTWEIPYISSNARQSIENAKKLLPNVTFVNWQVGSRELAKFYDKLYSLQGNHCACPSLAYLLFLPILSRYNVPYVVLGNEPAQIKNLYFNNIAPKIAYSYHRSKLLNVLYNVGRVVTFKKPLNFAQISYISAVQALLFDSKLRDKLSSNAQMVRNIRVALREMEGFVPTMQRLAKRINRSGRLPEFVHLHFDESVEGGYKWDSVKQMLVSEVGWVDCDADNKGLHTSCSIERCKEYSQYMAFRQMTSPLAPFSAIELCCAVQSGSLTREQAMLELDNLGFTLTPPCECQLMTNFVKDNQ